jgi:hypothetical protein
MVYVPEVATNCIELTQLSRFHLKTETEPSHRNVAFKKNRAMDGVQKHNSCPNNIYLFSTNSTGNFI